MNSKLHILTTAEMWTEMQRAGTRMITAHQARRGLNLYYAPRPPDREFLAKRMHEVNKALDDHQAESFVRRRVRNWLGK